jgi:hypothetical protein
LQLTPPLTAATYSVQVSTHHQLLAGRTITSAGAATLNGQSGDSLNLNPGSGRRPGGLQYDWIAGYSP